VLRASVTAPAPPGAKPMDISQQMMDALDKYARLQQQRDAQRDNVRDKGRAVDRGGQVDLIQ
jgi:hypothetical protein